MKLDVVRGADAALRAAAGLALAAAGLAMLAEIVARYAFDAPFVWTDEFAGLAFSWITFLGAAAVQRHDSHLSVDSLRTLAGPRLRAGMDLFRRAVIIACCAVLVWQGTALSIRMWAIEYPALEITRSALYLSVTVGAFFSLLFALRSIWRNEPPDQDLIITGQD
jgi:TRAP-type C4-dicarboxylate transport system permease small subunit